MRPPIVARNLKIVDVWNEGQLTMRELGLKFDMPVSLIRHIICGMRTYGWPVLVKGGPNRGTVSRVRWDGKTRSGDPA